MIQEAERPLFKVNELDIYESELEMNAFVETTRWWDMKIRLDLKNLLDKTETRYRVPFLGERDLSPVESRKLRQRTKGRCLILTFSGTF